MVNPARAGMILFNRLLHCRGYGKPRASGDDPAHYWDEDEVVA